MHQFEDKKANIIPDCSGKKRRGDGLRKSSVSFKPPPALRAHELILPKPPGKF